MKNWVKLLVAIAFIAVVVVVGFKLVNKKPIKDEIVVNSTVKNKDDKNIVAAYIPLWKEWKVDDIKGDKLTNLYLAFGTIGENSKLKVETSNGNEELKEKIKNLKVKFPYLKISIAIGGNAAEGFSDMTFVKESRESFCNSVVDFIEEYSIDGVDIDWEFPVQGAWGAIKARKEDKQNFAYLIKDLKDRLNTLESKNNKKYYISFAATSASWGKDIIDFKAVEPNIDSINIMSYDYTGGFNNTTCHNSNLYSREERKNEINIDAAVKMYISAGVPSKKLVLGIPAYGYGWTNVKNLNNGLFQSAEKMITPNESDLTYKNIKNNYVDKNGFKRFWDDKGKVPYLFDGKTFITYDDVESVKDKAKYVKDEKLGGMMIWEYLQDDNGELAETIYKNIYN